MAWWRRQDRGSTSSIGLSVAAALFALAFMTANLMVAKPGGADHSTGTLDLSASTVLGVVIAHGGTRAASSASWLTEPDDIGRFGMAQDGDPNFLDYRKIKSMRNGTMTVAANDAPDYPDVRAALGLGYMDFHLRTYPIIPGLDDPRWTKDPHGRLAYFAHYTGATGIVTTAHWVNTTADRLNVSIAIRNDGLSPLIFVSNVGLGDGSVTMLSEQRHTRLLSPGEVQTVWYSFPKLANWNNALTKVRIDVADAYGNTLVQPFWTAGTPPEGAGGASFGVKIHANQLYFTTSEGLEFNADHYNGDGQHLNSDQTGRFVLVGPNGKEWVNQSVTLPKAKNKQYTYVCPNCTATGTYLGIIYDSGMTRAARDYVHVSAAKMFNEKNTLDPIAAKEISLLQTLMSGFNGILFDPSIAPQGDVFGDDSNGPHGLAGELDRYSMIIVGSEVSQTALNAAATKYGIADWVQRGGTLIVLGTHTQQSNWLEPVYHAAQITANGGIGTPDPTHPVLSTPNKLDYRRYLDRARAWDIEEDAPFTHILTRGAGGTSMIDTLSIAAPGAYNEGTVVLTSYMPGEITAPQDDQEARRFLHNLMSQSYNMLFLDYGPPVPDDVPVGSGQRLVAVEHPNVPGAVVEVRIVMYTWQE